MFKNKDRKEIRMQARLYGNLIIYIRNKMVIRKKIQIPLELQSCKNQGIITTKSRIKIMSKGKSIFAGVGVVKGVDARSMHKTNYQMKNWWEGVCNAWKINWK